MTGLSSIQICSFSSKCVFCIMRRNNFRAPWWTRAGWPSLPLRQPENILFPVGRFPSPYLPPPSTIKSSDLWNEGKATYTTSSSSVRVKLCGIFSQARSNSFQALGSNPDEARKVAISWATVNLQRHFFKLEPYGDLRIDSSQFLTVFIKMWHMQSSQTKNEWALNPFHLCELNMSVLQMHHSFRKTEVMEEMTRLFKNTTLPSFPGIILKGI